MDLGWGPLAALVVGSLAACFPLRRATRCAHRWRAVWWLAAGGVAASGLGAITGWVAGGAQALDLPAAGHLLVVTAGLVMLRARTKGTDWTAGIDAACVTVGVAATALVFLSEGHGVFGLPLLAALAAAATIAMLTLAPGDRSVAYWLFLSALATLMAGDVIRVVEHQGAPVLGGSPTDLLAGLEVTAAALVGASAAHHGANRLTDHGRPRHAPLRVRSLIPLALALGLLPYAVMLGEAGEVGLHGPVFATVSLLIGLLVVVRTAVVTSARDAERASHERTAHRFRSLVENGSDIICTVDEEGFVEYVSPAVRQLLGHEPARLVGTVWYDSVHLSDVHRAREACGRVRTAAGSVVRLELRLKQRSAGWRWFEATVSNRLHDPAVGALVCNLSDISEQKRTQRELEHQALHDALTGLPNRALLLERLRVALSRATADSVALAFFDLDRFKEINDSLGHTAGDRLLSTIAQRLVRSVRPGDVVARFGGDELVLICEQLNGRRDALEIVQRAVSMISEPTMIDGHELRVTPSVGIAFAGGPDYDAGELIRDADAAMYLAKERGRARIEVFDYTMRERALRRMETSSGLHRAVDRGEFRVYYQPIVQVHTGIMTGVEALVRWAHPDYGLMAPSQFIDLAEELGLTAAIGEQVLRAACEDVARWDRLPDAPQLAVSVNISARQLRTAGFARSVERIIVSSALAAERICLEVTENVLLEHADVAAGTLKQLKRLGVRLGIDDFGAGYTSLSYLKRFPVDVMKIDQSFVRGICDHSEDAAIVSAVIDLAHTFGTSTVAEGIETPEQLLRLADMGCDYGQGYLFAEPRPPEAIERLLLAPDRLSVPLPADVTASG